MNIIMYWKHLLYCLVLSIKETVSYMKYSEKTDNEERRDYVLAVAAHTIEKGLGCVSYKKNWGISKAERLLKLMLDYIECGYDTHRFGFSDALAIVKEYIKEKDMRNENIHTIKILYKQLSDQLDETKICEYDAGKKILTREELSVGDINNVKKIFNRVRSIRNYDERDVEETDLLEAIKLSSKAPSACNRQPIKCYYAMDKDKINLIDQVLMGNAPIKGKTPNYIIVTSSTTFFSIYEYNQWYVNGGIFLGYLRVSLHSLGLGNCIYQWSNNNVREKELRKSFNIPSNEKIIAIVGVGYFPQEAHCIEAARKKLDDYVVRID